MLLWKRIFFASAFIRSGDGDGRLAEAAAAGLPGVPKATIELPSNSPGCAD